MANSEEIYTQILQALLPQGRIWPRDSEATLTNLLQSWADEMARVDGRADDLMDEVDPSTTLEMLSDFERVCGLPGKCADRRGDRGAKARRGPGQAHQPGRADPGLFHQLGLRNWATRWRSRNLGPFELGGATGDRAYGTPWAHAWRVHGPMDQFSFFTAGSFAGERLAAPGETKSWSATWATNRPGTRRSFFAYYAYIATEGDEVLTTEDGEDLII